jgi:hypothetical protein
MLEPEKDPSPRRRTSWLAYADGVKSFMQRLYYFQVVRAHPLIDKEAVTDPV